MRNWRMSVRLACGVGVMVATALAGRIGLPEDSKEVAELVDLSVGADYSWIELSLFGLDDYEPGDGKPGDTKPGDDDQPFGKGGAIAELLRLVNLSDDRLFLMTGNSISARRGLRVVGLSAGPAPPIVPPLAADDPGGTATPEPAGAFVIGAALLLLIRRYYFRKPGSISK